MLLTRPSLGFSLASSFELANRAQRDRNRCDFFMVCIFPKKSWEEADTPFLLEPAAKPIIQFASVAWLGRRASSRL